MDRSLFTPGIETCAHRGEKSATEGSGRTGEGRKHALWHYLAAKHVAGRDGAALLRLQRTSQVSWSRRTHPCVRLHRRQ